MRKWVLSFTAIFLWLLAFNWAPQLRGGWGWNWPYQKPSAWGPVVVLALVVGIYIGGVWLIRRVTQRVWIALCWAILAGFVVALAVQNVRDNPFFMLFSHTVSPVQTGASTVAVQYFGEDGADETLKNWPDVMRDAEEKTITHFTTSPPGQALIHYWLATWMDSVEPVSQPVNMALRPYQCSTSSVMRYERGEIVSAGLGMMMPLWAGLAVLPIFLVAREFTGQPDAARRIAQWWPLVPSLLLFAPTWSTFYPFLTAGALAFLVIGLNRRRLYYSSFAGLVMSVATFLNFAVLPVLGLLGLYTLLYAYFQREKWYWPIMVGLWFALGLGSVWVIFWLHTDLTPLDILEVTFEQHLDIERNYFIWLLLHPYDMLMFAGWPLAALGMWGLWRAMRSIRRNENIEQVDMLVLSLVLIILILDLTGITRGESARIWLFFVPFVLLSGARLFQQQPNWDMPLLIGQGVSVVVMGTVLPVVTFDMKPPVEGPRTDIDRLERFEFRPVDVVFESNEYEGRFRLQGYRFVADPARRAITIEFAWEGDQQVERPYRFEVTIYGGNRFDDLIIVPPYHWYPQDGNYLTTCWQRGEQIYDVEVIELPVVSAPVEWKLELRAVDEVTGDTMQVIANGRVSTAVTLGPIPYP